MIWFLELSAVTFVFDMAVKCDFVHTLIKLGIIEHFTLRAEVENKLKFLLHMECLVLF